MFYDSEVFPDDTLPHPETGSKEKSPENGIVETEISSINKEYLSIHIDVWQSTANQQIYYCDQNRPTAGLNDDNNSVMKKKKCQRPLIN